MNEPRKRAGSTIDFPTSKHRRTNNSSTQWDIKLLAQDEYRKNYRTELTTCSRAIMSIENEQNDTDNQHPVHLWKKIEKIVKQSANSTIPVQKETMSPTRITAANELKQERDRLSKDPSNANLQHRVQEAKQHMEKLNQMHLDNQCKLFFDEIEKVHPQRRIAMTY